MTLENKEFLEQLIIDKYKSKDSPLKESPWKRGKFESNEMYKNLKINIVKTIKQFYLLNQISNKRIGVLAIKLGSMPQWTKSGKKIYTTLLQVLDNHVIDYIPPSIYMKKDKDNRSKNGLLGMAIVGAISADPRLVNF